LLRRLEQTHACLAAVKHMLPSVQEEGDVLTAYQLTHQAMQQFIINMHNEWFHTFDSSISQRLQDNLLMQDKADSEFPRQSYSSTCEATVITQVWRCRSPSVDSIPLMHACHNAAAAGVRTAMVHLMPNLLCQP